MTTSKVEALKTAGLTDTEIADFQEYQTQKEHREKVKQAKEIAREMISEDGKYYVQYKKLDDQCNAIWEKALSEARKTVGLVEEDE